MFFSQKNPAFLNPVGKTLPHLPLPGQRAWGGNPVNSAQPEAHGTVGLHSRVRKMGVFLLTSDVCHGQRRDGTGNLEVSREGLRMSI